MVVLLVGIAVGVFAPQTLWSNPWNGEAVLQAFWWDCWNERYPQDWYTYLAKLAPRLRDTGFDGIWIPSPVKGNPGSNSMGYDPFDHYIERLETYKPAIFRRMPPAELQTAAAQPVR
jgi:alpha-amylase